MPRRKRATMPEEPELFTNEETLPEDWEPEEPEAEEEQSLRITLAAEPLFTALLRQAVAKLWPGDAIMADFVTHVASPSRPCWAPGRQKEEILLLSVLKPS